ncbi:hypothetical protein D9M71_576770 [compost metagenome]
MYLRFSQLRIAGQVHLTRARSLRCIHQGAVAVDAHGLDTPAGQRAQQPALTTAQVEHPFGLAAEDGQQDGLVGDLATAFDGAAAYGVDPDLGVMVPTVEQGVFRGAHDRLHQRKR